MKISWWEIVKYFALTTIHYTSGGRGSTWFGVVVAGSTVQPKLALYSQQSYLSLPSARTIDVHHQVQPSKVYKYLFLQDEILRPCLALIHVVHSM